MTELDKEQRTRIGKVLEYIENHLDQTLNLDNLAKRSTYSPSHFHRLFTEMIGETPANYVKRRRLEKAAHDLIYEPKLAVTEIGQRYGFTSLSYFTTAFTERYQHSPRAWREGAYLEKFPRRYLHSKKSKQNSRNEQEMNPETRYTRFQWVDLSKVKTEMFPEGHIVLSHRFGPYTQELADTWEQIYRWAEARELITKGTRLLGVPRNNPYITPLDKCRYDCCIIVPSGTPTGNEVESGSFQGGKFVVYEFDEPIEYSRRDILIECYSELYSFWLPRSGYRYLGDPVELVQIRPNSSTLDLDCRITAISLPIEPK
ncbi:AraC family transcriptional regulator [Paenibacillus tyrfis]|uniref:AraC family transcriptional regulator n=1 Tax=Paenibacillus tyrfis TaxID=1501230 RepID=UPI000B5896E2|nr:helix-turn-helix domain-containing protein [Paenibacillus tyrfis]